MNIQIEFNLADGPGRVMVEGETTIDALLAWLDSLPENSRVTRAKATVLALLAVKP